ncbi:MAG: DUF935 domain-containing protein [Rhodospirillaceae bacterium]|nr:DUF935 domain-containing protein [Rhodospirillaceae bacterium]
MATILDHRGNPVRQSVLKKELAGPTVTGVRSILSEHPAQGLTPGRLGVLLREAETGDATRYLELAEEMEEKSLHYLAVLGTRKRQISQLDVTVEPAGDSADAQKDADLVNEWLATEQLEGELVDILDAIGKGFSVTEIMWDLSESQWMPQRLEFRDPRWFEFDDIDGRTLLMRGLDNSRQPLAPFKFVVHRFQAKSGLLIRGGFARMVAWFYLFANYTVKDWVQFIETYGQPFRIGKYPPNATPEDRGVLLRALTNLGADAAAMVPESMILEFAKAEGSTGSGQTTTHEKFLAYTDALISKAVLGQTLTTEAGERGARSLGEVHDEVRRDIERSDAFALSQTLSRDIARPIVALNRGERRRYPRIVISRADSLDVARVSDALAKLVPLGLQVPADPVRELIGIRAPEEGEELLRPAVAPGTGDPDDEDVDGNTDDAGDEPEDEEAEARAVARALARLNRADRASDLVDGLADEIDDETRAAQDADIDKVRALIESAGSMQEIADRLLELQPDLDAAALAGRLREALTVAHLMGRADILDQR